MVLLPLSYLGLLDRVQARAKRLARLKAPEAAAHIIQPLQQRRDVAGMCVMYKADRMQLLQLAELRLNPRARPSHATRVAHNIDRQVTVPFARTEHYLRSFLPRYGRLWNTLVRQTDLHLTTSMPLQIGRKCLAASGTNPSPNWSLAAVSASFQNGRQQTPKRHTEVR
ncbi:hypothetical protein GWK47_048893 [Chionoecetes opilio]|uniref:Uncharacterized protein n=1 Tax=Chionoecetes opilio TaxID=41210 RepID=A0A8J4YBI8_CHIOP|nr:hypothetical protein GWK47_048893 [Chionoecetes opilio]